MSFEAETEVASRESREDQLGFNPSNGLMSFEAAALEAIATKEQNVSIPRMG